MRFPTTANPMHFRSGTSSRNLCERSEPAFRLRQRKLAQGYSLSRHDADTRLGSIQLLLSGDERGAALGAAAISASRRGHWIITPDPASEKDVARLFDATGGGSSPGDL